MRPIWCWLVHGHDWVILKTHDPSPRDHPNRKQAQLRYSRCRLCNTELWIDLPGDRIVLKRP